MLKAGQTFCGATEHDIMIVTGLGKESPIMDARNEADISSLTNVERKAIREFKKKISIEFPSAKLILFGSKARGDHQVRKMVAKWYNHL